MWFRSELILVLVLALAGHTSAQDSETDPTLITDETTSTTRKQRASSASETPETTPEPITTTEEPATTAVESAPTTTTEEGITATEAAEITATTVFDPCSNVLDIVDGSAVESVPLLQTVYRACLTPVRCVRTVSRPISTFYYVLYDAISVIEGQEPRAMMAAKLINEFVAENVGIEGVGDAIKNAVISAYNVTISTFVECASRIETTTVTPVTFTTSEVSEGPTTTVVPDLEELCQSTADVLDDQGQLDQSAIHIAIREACLYTSCSVENQMALEEFAFAISDVVHETFRSDNDKLLNVSQMIEEFFISNDCSAELKQTIMLAEIPNWGTVATLLNCSVQGSCGLAGHLLDSHGLEDDSDIHYALYEACEGKPCLREERSRVEKLSTNVSDYIRVGFKTADQLLLNITATVKQFMETTDSNSVAYAAVRDAQISNWGTVRQFADCYEYAYCTVGIEDALEEYTADGWCRLLDAVERCTGCTRDEKKTSKVLAETIWTETAGKATKQKKMIAANILQEKHDNADEGSAEVIKKIYQTTISNWETIEKFMECAFLV